MKPLPRERIALVVFGACILLILAGIVAYLFAGHSFNHAASHIDDAAGEMDGYRVVLFEGTGIPQTSQVDAHGFRERSAQSLAKTANDYRSKEAVAFLLDAQNLASYDEPVVFERGGYRIGVLSIEPDDSSKSIQSRLETLHGQNARAVIAFSSKALNKAEADGIDVLIECYPAGERQKSNYERNTTVMRMPAVGSIAAVVISPSEVVSTKVA